MSVRISRRLAEVGESATLAMQQRAAALAARGVDVVDLGIGEPDFPTPKPAIDGAIAALEEGFTKYTATAGIPELRDAISARYRALWGGPWSRESVAVTVGGKQALYNVFMATLDPGDEVVIPSPCWVSFPDQVLLAGATPRLVASPPERGFVPDPDEVERACGPRTRALVLNSPSNPTGAVLPRETLARLVALAVERDLLVVFDETYERFLYGDEGHVSAASFHRELGDRLALVSSFSKTYAMPGLRLGFLLGSPELAKAVSTFQSHTTSNAASIAQRAGLAALTGAEDAVREMLREYRSRRDRVVEALRGIDGLDLVPPAGAFYAFPRVEGAFARLGVGSSLELAGLLLERHHVAVVPGSAFGAEGFLRISFATGAARLAEGLRRIRAAFGA